MKTPKHWQASSSNGKRNASLKISFVLIWISKQPLCICGLKKFAPIFCFSLSQLLHQSEATQNLTLLSCVSGQLDLTGDIVAAGHLAKIAPPRAITCFGLDGLPKCILMPEW